MSVKIGLDQLIGQSFLPLRGKTVGLVCNQASVASNFRHVLEIFREQDALGVFHLKTVFGPQHGLYGHTQDNMIEWESGDIRPLPFRLYSLYGEHREPTPDMLEGLDCLVVDLQDVGSRYYTFIWTMALCLKACEALGIPVIVLDRPNPINGVTVDGTVLDPSFASFVGLYPLPMRHGMTMSEIAEYLRGTYFPKANLVNVLMEGWDRTSYQDENKAPWAIPSPNMPTVDTAVVYPGGCLIEGTNLSEGRGTTRPFEIIGASYLDGWKLADRLNARNLPGVYFRALQFEPTFNKHGKRLCEGVFIHVLDRNIFSSVSVTVALLQDVLSLTPSDFSWNPPPYEYEYNLLPIDILNGNEWLRESIEEQLALSEIEARFRSEQDAFLPIRAQYLLYSQS